MLTLQSTVKVLAKQVTVLQQLLEVQTGARSFEATFAPKPTPRRRRPRAQDAPAAQAQPALDTQPSGGVSFADVARRVAKASASAPVVSTKPPSLAQQGWKERVVTVSTLRAGLKFAAVVAAHTDEQLAKNQSRCSRLSTYLSPYLCGFGDPWRGPSRPLSPSRLTSCTLEPVLTRPRWCLYC